MYASKHPFRDTLVIEIDRDDVLDVHGALLSILDYSVPEREGDPETRDEFMSILEAFIAKMDLSKFERSNDV